MSKVIQTETLMKKIFQNHHLMIQIALIANQTLRAKKKSLKLRVIVSLRVIERLRKKMIEKLS